MAKSEYKITLEAAPEGKQQLIIEGELSIDSVAKMYDELLALASNPDLKCIRIRNVSNIDLAVLQMLAAWAKKRRADNQPVEFAFELDEPLTELLDHAGISDMLQSISRD